MKKLFVLGIAALLLVAFSVPAMAEVKIGGIIFTDAYYLQRNSKSAAIYEGTNGKESYGNTRIQVPNITRLYGRWTNEDNVGMYIEFGLGTGAVADSSSEAVNIRHAYGWWDVNSQFQILAGHTTTPFSPLLPSQLLGTSDNSLNIIGMGYGEFYSGRFAQVRGTFELNKMFGIALAVVDPNLGNRFVDGSAGVNPQDYTTNTKIPRFDIGAHINVGPVVIYPSFLWQQKTYDKQVNSSIDDSVSIYAGSLGVKFGMGPMMLAAEGQYGQNWGNTGAGIGIGKVSGNAATGITPLNTAGASPIGVYRPTVNSDYQLDDTTDWSYWVDLAFKFGPITPHLLFGQMGATGDNSPTDFRSMMYGISCPIQLAKGFSVRPELMWYDDGDSNTAYNSVTATQYKQDSGSYQVFGVQFQITF